MARLRVVFFDLGMTLVDERRQPFPYAAEAVSAIQGLPDAAGGVLMTALVSDFETVSAPPTAAKVERVFARYLELLDATGLRALFEPVAQRVTLSAHAGVEKPARAVFETALRRLGSDAELSQCLLITENVEHVRAVKSELGMQALLFRSPGSEAFDFDDWRQAPALVARMLDPDAPAAFERSLERHGQVGPGRGPLGEPPTHERETDAQGQTRLVRKRFNAF